MNQKSALLTAIVLIGLGCTSVAAQDNSTVDCSKAVSQLDMNFCAQRDYEKADAELNAVWREATSAARTMDDQEAEEARKGAAKSLLAAQRGWIAYRDGACELAGWEARGGSLEPLLVSSCLAEMTQKRVKELKQFATGEQ